MNDKDRLDYVLLRLLAGQGTVMGRQLQHNFTTQDVMASNELGVRAALDKLMKEMPNG